MGTEIKDTLSTHYFWTEELKTVMRIKIIGSMRLIEIMYYWMNTPYEENNL